MPANSQPQRGKLDRISWKWLAIALVAGLIHGLITTFLAPPWQHYDEPKHFERVWLSANLGRLPIPGDQDETLSRVVVESMVLHDFYGKGYTPEQFIKPGEPVSIPGISQLDEPPFYYLAASAPLRLLGGWDVTDQLYIARLVSLGFFLVTIFAGWGLVVELTQPENPLRWMLPLSLALLPGLADSMTAVNNDAAAVAVVSMMLWVGVRLIQRGFSLLDFLWACAVAGLAFFTKSTAMLALILLPLAVLFSLLRRQLRPVAWAVVLGGILLLLASTLAWGDAAGWYRATNQNDATRMQSDQAVVGEHVIRVAQGAAISPVWLVPLTQPILAGSWNEAATKVYTLGGWVWSDAPVTVRSPQLGLDGQVYDTTLEVSSEPTFIAISGSQAEQPYHRLWVNLDPRLDFGENKANVYYDGMVLVEGDYSSAAPPEFLDANSESGTWGGQPFENLLRNASGEQVGLRLRGWVDRLGSRFLPDQIQPSFVAAYLLDWRGAAFSYLASGERLLHTFWGAFGWGHVALLGAPWIYWLLLGFFLLGSIGGVIVLVQHLRQKLINWEVLFFLGFALILAWGAAFLRGSIYVALPNLYLPVARYAYVAVVPTLLMMTIGWNYIISMLASGKTQTMNLLRGAYVGLWLGLCVLSFASLGQYYYG